MNENASEEILRRFSFAGELWGDAAGLFAFIGLFILLGAQKASAAISLRKTTFEDLLWSESELKIDFGTKF